MLLFGSDTRPAPTTYHHPYEGEVLRSPCGLRSDIEELLHLLEEFLRSKRFVITLVPASTSPREFVASRNVSRRRHTIDHAESDGFPRARSEALLLEPLGE